MKGFDIRQNQDRWWIVTIHGFDIVRNFESREAAEAWVRELKEYFYG